MTQNKINIQLTEQNVLSELGRLWDAVPILMKEKGVTFLMSTETAKLICQANGFQFNGNNLKDEVKLFGCSIWYHKMIQSNYVEPVDTEYWQKCLEANERFNL